MMGEVIGGNGVVNRCSLMLSKVVLVGNPEAPVMCGDEEEEDVDVVDTLLELLVMLV